MDKQRVRLAARVDALADDDFAELERAVAARRCRERIGIGTFDEAAAAYRPSPKCPAAPDRIWIDETYINDTDLSKGYGEARKRGLSKQKVCIAVAIDVHKSPVAIVCGHGKPTSKRIKDGLLPHIAEGSHIVHDKEKSHSALIRATKCTEESYKTDVRDPVHLECMAMVNGLCSWLKRYLWHFTGMDPANLQSYLNWLVYLFRVNQARDKWPRTERVVRHLLMTDAYYCTSQPI